MSIFGWSYPPGCSGPPEDSIGPCECCGQAVYDCECPECPVCSEFGNPKCYHDHGLLYAMEQIHGQAILEDSYFEQAKWDRECGDEWEREQEMMIREERRKDIV